MDYNYTKRSSFPNSQLTFDRNYIGRGSLSKKLRKLKIKETPEKYKKAASKKSRKPFYKNVTKQNNNGKRKMPTSSKKGTIKGFFN